jgi:hypothetical protein
MKLKQNDAELNGFKKLNTISLNVSQELPAVFPTAVSVWMTKTPLEEEVGSSLKGKADNSPDLKVTVHWMTNPAKSDLAKATEFLSRCLSVDNRSILHLRIL